MKMCRPKEASKDGNPPKQAIPEQVLFSERHRFQSGSKVLTSADIKHKDTAERPSKRAVSPNSLQQFQSWEQSTFQDDKAVEARCGCCTHLLMTKSMCCLALAAQTI